MARLPLPRLIALGFAIWIATTAGDRAQALGCHIGDRPQLGGFVALDPYLLTIDELAGESLDPGNWIPRSCPEDAPQPPTTRVVIDQLSNQADSLDSFQSPTGWLRAEASMAMPTVAHPPTDPPPRCASDTVFP
jgi:hypothetical protein